MRVLVIAVLGMVLGCSAIRPGQTAGLVLNHDGLRRTYLLHVPKDYNPDTPTPVVLVLHGGFGSGGQARGAYGFDVIADKETFLVVYPDGIGFIRTWNAGTCCGPAAKNGADDVGFITALVDEVAREVNVDRKRVYATGMSNGAMLSHRLACEKADVFAAVAPVSGTLSVEGCTPSRPVPIFQVYGSQDKHVPLEGQRECGFGDVDPQPAVDTARTWRTANACSGPVGVFSDENHVRCETGGTCGAETVMCVVDGGGHDWPGGQPTPRFVNAVCDGDGPQNTDWNASEKIWEFFKAHPLP